MENNYNTLSRPHAFGAQMGKGKGNVVPVLN